MKKLNKILYVMFIGISFYLTLKRPKFKLFFDSNALE